MTTVENRGPQLLVVCIVLLSISIISLTLRVWTRLFIVRAFDRDDYLMVSAAVSAIIMPYAFNDLYHVTADTLI